MTGVFENSFLPVEKALYGPAKTNASWIKQNMLESPPKRVLTEAELRVQRATQKLDIPEWYLNKKSKAPKILKNDTPIDYRLPAWRLVGTKPKKIPGNSPNNTTDPTGVYKVSPRHSTSMNESLLSGSYGTPRMFEKWKNQSNTSSTIYEIPEVDESETQNPEPNQAHDSINSLRSSILSLNKSSTLPKISPSRKVTNINIVFPSTKTSPKPNLSESSPPLLSLENNCETDLNANFIYEAKKPNLFENSYENMLSEDEKFNTPRRMKMNTSSFNSSFVNVISPRPFSKKVGTPFTTPVCDFIIPANSTSIGTESTLFTSALDKPNPARTSGFCENTEKDLDFSSNSVASNLPLNQTYVKPDKDSEQKPLTYWLGEVKPVGSDCPETCEECGAKAPRVFAAVTRLSPKNMNQVFKEEYLSRKVEKMLGTPEVQPTPTASLADHKTVEQEKEIPQENNLVDDIIQELKDKCTLTNSYSSTGTKYFVKRLVTELGGETLADTSIEEEVEPKSPESDRELNLEGSLSSISYKASEPGNNCGLVTSTLKSTVNKCRIKNIKKPLKTYSESYEKDGVFWIPMKIPTPAKTSRLASIKSKCPESETDSLRMTPIPDLSDIHPVDEQIHQNCYETIDYMRRPRQTAEQFYKIHKGRRVLDSGYSDRSNNNKSAGSISSLSDGSWIENHVSSPVEITETCFSIEPDSKRVYRPKKNKFYTFFRKSLRKFIH